MAVHLGLGLGLNPPPSEIAKILAGIRGDPNVQIYGRDGTRSVATPGCTYLDPQTGNAVTTNTPYYLTGPGGFTLPMDLAYPVATNLFLNAQAPATQNCTVVIGSVTVTAIGSGYTITTSAGTATGSGFGAVTLGTPQVLAITGNGTITITIGGSPVAATVQVQAGALRTPLIVTAGATATRAVDANLWTLPDALTQDEEIIVLGEQDYADGDMGVASQMWVEGGSAFTAPRIFRASSTTQTASDYDGGSKTSTGSATQPNRGVLALRRVRRTPTTVQGGFGRSLIGSATAGGSSWDAPTSIRVGHSATAGRAGFGRFGAIRFKNGASQARIDALFFALANGRTVPVVA